MDPLLIGWVFAAAALLMLASCEVGYQIGDRIRTRLDREAPVPMGSMVGGLLALLAFVLAFSFSLAAAQHDLRKRNVLDEANAVGTAYLRADLLPLTHAEPIRRLLREYVDVRLQAAKAKNLDEALARSVEIHALLWRQAVAAALEGPNTNTSLVLQSINEVIDMHARRLTAALHNRIPGSVWTALFAISMLTMIVMGAQIGLAGRRRWVAVVPLSLAFAVLVTLVVDLDRPGGAMIHVGQAAMIDLQRSLESRPK